MIIDESHQNFTEKSDAIVQLFKTDKIIRCSATPIIDKSAKLIEISEADVIAEGLIKKLLVINGDFPALVATENPTEYLLEKALKKQNKLVSSFAERNENVNPLIVVQLPNNSDSLLYSVISWFESQHISIENGLLAVWLSARHDNLEDIEKNDGKQTAVIIKQAVATGWDCPRAYILVKLREGMDETFEIQTIGRIRRMPEAHHYESDLLDSCYLYTFDSKFTEGAKLALGKNALSAKTIFLKNEYKTFTLTKEQRTQVLDTQDDALALKAITEYLKTTYGIDGDCKKNKLRLETGSENAEKFVFSEKIEKTTLSGEATVISDISSDSLNTVKFRQKLNTHTHGREFHNRVGRIGLEIGLEYASAVTILGKLFANEGKFLYKQKLFYPDYILSVKGKIWICETKGGFDRTGASEDIDIFSPKKCAVLQKYLKKHNLHGGFVRQDKASMELLICTGEYSDDVNSDAWQVLGEVMK